MNIVTPILTALAYPTANVNTESARRDNALRETIPQSADAEKGASQKGLGSESDKSKNPGLPPAPVTYERPQVQSDLQSAFENVFGEQKDNASDESAGKQDAQDKQRSEQQTEQQAQQEVQEIDDLKARDKEVRTHEQAHAATGGQYAGSPSYEYTTGPDNQRYVTDGEVSIDISEMQTPEQTVRKMQQVRAAALAPAQPSAQDLKVAAEASQKAFEARSEIAENNSASQGVGTSPKAGEISPPSLDEITEHGEIEPPTRSLDEVLSAQQTGVERQRVSEVGARSLDFGNDIEVNDTMSARVNRIQNFYAQAYTPAREGFSASV